MNLDTFEKLKLSAIDKSKNTEILKTLQIYLQKHQKITGNMNIFREAIKNGKSFN